MNFNSFGLGIANYLDDQLLELGFSVLLHQAPLHFVQGLTEITGLSAGQHLSRPDQQQLTALAKLCLSNQWVDQANIISELAKTDQTVAAVFLAEDQPPTDSASVWLKLHLLSARMVKPNQVNLEGIFSLLPNLAWTNEGPILPEKLPDRRLAAQLAGRRLVVDSVDKFPRMSDYLIPSGVRIADTRRIRLGAYIGEGTTVMHEGFINFNAGTLGTAMVEGRISQGVTVGEESDLGGGASTMGTLAGGGGELVSLGRNCLIGANSGTGIPLGDHCTIEAGLYVTAGTVVSMVDESGQITGTAKARELANQSNLLFIRNSKTGQVECRPNRKTSSLNQDLHAHN